jgi:hypothetical protein
MILLTGRIRIVKIPLADLLRTMILEIPPRETVGMATPPRNWGV